MAVADRLGELRFPVTASIVATLIVIVLGGVYGYIIRKVPETVLFIAAASAGAGAILGAFYTARGLELTASALARDEIRYKTALAFQFTSKWNDPAMFHVRDAVRELLTGDHNSVEFSALLTSQQTNVIHFLNFLEEVAIALEKAGADPDILREAFRGIVLTAWSKLQAWAVEQRRKRNTPRLWTNVEDLAKKWN
jgi:Domain of unknown function (DUF4760)